MTNPDVTYALLGAADAISDHAFRYSHPDNDELTTYISCKNCGSSTEITWPNPVSKLWAVETQKGPDLDHTPECVIKKILELINMETTE